MSIIQAMAVVTLWNSGRFDSLDIATALGLSESNVVKLLDEVRNRERGPDLHIVAGVNA